MCQRSHTREFNPFPGRRRHCPSLRLLHTRWAGNARPLTSTACTEACWSKKNVTRSIDPLLGSPVPDSSVVAATRLARQLADRVGRRLRYHGRLLLTLKWEQRMVQDFRLSRAE